MYIYIKCNQIIYATSNAALNKYIGQIALLKTINSTKCIIYILQIAL